MNRITDILHTARLLRSVWPFLDTIHERVKGNLPWKNITFENFVFEAQLLLCAVLEIFKFSIFKPFMMSYVTKWG